jgi:hypothetical protein
LARSIAEAGLAHLKGSPATNPSLVRSMGMAMKWVISLMAFPSEFFYPDFAWLA